MPHGEKHADLRRRGQWLSLEELQVCRGRKKFRAGVGFTLAAYGPVQVLAWWDSAYAEPLYLVSNLTERDEICRRYRKRTHIETLFSDQKGRGFHLHQSHLSDSDRVGRLMIATCLAYIWIVYQGARVLCRPAWRRRIHRSDRCDLSLFQLGLRLLNYLLKAELPVPIAFLPEPKRSQMVAV